MVSFKNLAVCVQNIMGNPRGFQNEAGKPNVALLLNHNIYRL